jgi:hypothetical protein
MRFFLRCFILAFPLLLRAGDPAPVAVPAPASDRGNYVPIRSGQWSFSLLPKAFQRNPTLDLTANTEVTDYGRMFRPASTENPVYYVAQAGGFKQMGNVMAGETPPRAEDMEHMMKSALAVNGYRETDMGGHPPSLLVAYSWGSHNRLDMESAAQFPQLALQQKLERAILVGGKKYREERAFATLWGEKVGDQTMEKDFLQYQAADSLYFVIASAYDYVALGRHEKKLVWRTTMTVNATGINLRESLPPLVMNGAPFLGRETATPQIAQRRVKSGSVEVGAPTVIDEKKSKP